MACGRHKDHYNLEIKYSKASGGAWRAFRAFTVRESVVGVVVDLKTKRSNVRVFDLKKVCFWSLKIGVMQKSLLASDLIRSRIENGAATTTRRKGG